MDNMQNNFDETTVLNQNVEPQYNVQPEVTVEPEIVEAPAKKSSNVLAIISLVAGILSVVLSCCCGWLSIVFSIAAVILGIISPKNEYGKKSGMAIAGIICGAVGIVGFVISLILGGLSFLGGFMEGLESGYNGYY